MGENLTVSLVVSVRKFTCVNVVVMTLMLSVCLLTLSRLC